MSRPSEIRAIHAQPLDARDTGLVQGGPSFSLYNRLERMLFRCVWALAAAWTPPPLHRWRCFLLRLFGARIGRGARFYGSAIVWHPANLTLGDHVTVGPRVRLYNQGAVSIRSRAVVSQGAHICASTHRANDPDFQLVLRPIEIGEHAWVAADAFVGPGVRIGTGAVLGARAVTFDDLDAWTIYRGNPAEAVKRRAFGRSGCARC
ncbi:putative colanic acid biosynthesis acetyltransferase WcaF [Novosphingobium sp. CF614]|uniref:putative colanic acid biosynthesis acetyltransferase n=1 Tax=Novosphingobium sp. CF614 TaxID=1884364 RepID=UPI0008E81CF4|nr:putative colanic acid biosynthesis acetyltransferase [Novosphingobium sp. CF614]SFF94694.1 putative colanic acid biosynthesis acetyltransferase WcaF [Novosphingobium sp. CF614]